MKILVAHPAQQHSYRLAEALSGRGMLCAYATTVYYKKHSLTALAAHFLRGTMKKKAQGRVSPVLRPEQVVQSPAAVSAHQVPYGRAVCTKGSPLCDSGKGGCGGML